MNNDNDSDRIKEVKSLSKIFNISNEMNDVHKQLVEVVRRIEKIEHRLPDSWIPKYRMRDDPEYTPLGGVLDNIFEQLDDLYDMMEKSYKENTPKEIDYQNQLDKLNKKNGN